MSQLFAATTRMHDLMRCPQAGRVPSCSASSSPTVSAISPRGTTASQKPCSSKNSERWNPLGRRLCMFCSITRGPANAVRASGSARIISPSMAKLAVTPPVVGSVSTVIYRPPTSLWRLTAAEILAICISDVTPSCMRAPPETVKPTTGNPSSVARSNVRQIFSPTTEPIEPIIKLASIKKSAVSQPQILPLPHTTASCSPERSLTLLSLSA